MLWWWSLVPLVGCQPGRQLFPLGALETLCPTAPAESWEAEGMGFWNSFCQWIMVSVSTRKALHLKVLLKQ